jgi:hypothetical protein
MYGDIEFRAKDVEEATGDVMIHFGHGNAVSNRQWVK